MQTIFTWLLQEVMFFGGGGGEGVVSKFVQPIMNHKPILNFCI